MQHARILDIEIIDRNDGDAFEFGGLQVHVFWAPAAWQSSTQPRNNDSLVMHLRYRDSAVPLEGDADSPVEKREWLASMI